MSSNNCHICDKNLDNIPYRRKYCSDECRIKQKNIDQRLYQQNWRRKKRGEPPVSKDDMIECLICSRKYIQLGSHVVQKHGMTAREYKEEFGLNVSKGLVPDWFHKEKREETLSNGSWKILLDVGKATRFQEGSDRAGQYVRSEQTLKMLKKRCKKMHKINKNKQRNYA